MQSVAFLQPTPRLLKGNDFEKLDAEGPRLAGESELLFCEWGTIVAHDSDTSIWRDDLIFTLKKTLSDVTNWRLVAGESFEAQ